MLKMHIHIQILQLETDFSKLQSAGGYQAIRTPSFLHYFLILAKNSIINIKLTLLVPVIAIWKKIYMFLKSK